MKYTVEESLRDFKAWSEARKWLDQAIENDTVEAVEEYISDLFYGEELPSDTTINDLLWFDDEIHRIIENKTVRERLEDLDTHGHSPEALDFIADTLDDTDDNDTLEDALSEYSEFPSLESALRIKDCDGIDELNRFYTVDVLDNGRVLLS